MRSGYSTLQITLHWLIAVLILAAWFTHEGMGRIFHQRLEAGTTGIEGNTVHVWLGGAALALTLIRVIVRWMQGAPDHTPETPPRMAKYATWGHILLYVLMIAVPGLGAAAWYGHIHIAGNIHEIAAQALMLAALGHAVMAIYHHIFLKDGTLTRMTRPGWACRRHPRQTKPEGSARPRKGTPNLVRGGLSFHSAKPL